jgi:hypothetical protein
MIISEKQIMQLIEYSSCLLSRLNQRNESESFRHEIAETINEIVNQQSSELKEME